MSVALVLFGAWSWTQMTVEAYPDLGDVTVQVTTQVNRLAAEEIEQQITTPLERALSNTRRGRPRSARAAPSGCRSST